MIFILNYSCFLTSLQNRQRTLPSLNQLDIELAHFILKSMRPKKRFKRIANEGKTRYSAQNAISAWITNGLKFKRKWFFEFRIY